MPFPSKTNQEMILAAATEIVERDGIEALSMREIARRLELAPNALYYHFKDRDELEAEIAAEGLRQLLAAVKRAAQRGAGRGSGGAAAAGPEAIIQTSHAYLRFARARPALYQLMIRKHTPTPGLLSAKAELQGISQRLFSWMKSPEEIAEANFTFFALLHGIATLEREGMLEDDLRRDPTYAISALLTGLSQLASWNNGPFAQQDQEVVA